MFKITTGEAPIRGRLAWRVMEAPIVLRTEVCYPFFLDWARLLGLRVESSLWHCVARRRLTKTRKGCTSCAGERRGPRCCLKKGPLDRGIRGRCGKPEAIDRLELPLL